MPAVHAKDEAEPVFAVFAKAGPAYRSSQAKGVAFEACLFSNLAADARSDIFLRIELSAQAIVLAEVRVIGPAVAMDQEDLAPVRGQDICQGGQDRCKRHATPCC